MAECVKEPGKLTGLAFLHWVSIILNDRNFTKQADGHKEIEAFAQFERLHLKAGQRFDLDQYSTGIKAAKPA